jgi:hypothetical protein
MALVATLAAVGATIVACDGGGSSSGGSTSAAPQTRTTTPTSPPAPVNLTGTWTTTVNIASTTPQVSGPFTLRITQSGSAISCSASGNVAPVIGSDLGCSAVVNNLTPTNNRIDVQFTIQFPPSAGTGHYYDQIQVSYTADFITSDGLRMSGPFAIGWRRDYTGGGGSAGTQVFFHST